MSIKEKFVAAVDVVNSIPYDGTFEPSDEIMLKFYAYEKQATEGACKEPKPYIWNTIGRSKWNAWSDLGNMSSHKAMEKYIEELTKVIETMSYNEKIAKFLSLMGSFYEIVSPEDCEPGSAEKSMMNHWPEDLIPSAVLENYESPTISDMYRIVRRERQTEFPTEKEVHDVIGYFTNKSSLNPQTVRSNASPLSRAHSQQRYSQSSLSSSTDSSSDISNFDLLSDLSDVDAQVVSDKTSLHLFQNSQHSQVSHCPTHNDIFILTFINLQSSMDDILEKMNSLTTLADKDSDESCQYNSNLENESEFSLNWTGTIFALLWPVVVEVMLG